MIVPVVQQLSTPSRIQHTASRKSKITIRARRTESRGNRNGPPVEYYFETFKHWLSTTLLNRQEILDETANLREEMKDLQSDFEDLIKEVRLLQRSGAEMASAVRAVSTALTRYSSVTLKLQQYIGNLQRCVEELLLDKLQEPPEYARPPPAKRRRMT